MFKHEGAFVIMFGRRQFSNQVLIESTATPVDAVLESVVVDRNLVRTKRLYPVTYEEVFACIDYYLDTTEISNKEFIELEVTHNAKNELSLHTLGLSKWVFLAVLAYGNVHLNTDDLKRLFAVGLHHILRDILKDLYINEYHFKESMLHQIVYDAFVKSYGELEQSDIEYLLSSLKFDFGEINGIT